MNIHSGSDLPVPPELLTVVGNPRNPAEENFFAWAFPEGDFFQTPPGRAHQLLAPLMSDSYKRLQEKYKPRSTELLEKIRDYHLHRPEAPPQPDNLAARLKEEAGRLGIDVIGITNFDRRYVYSNYKRRVHFKRVIVIGAEQPWAPTQEQTGSSELLDVTLETFLRITELAINLADFLRANGYRTQFLAGPLGLDLVKILPYAVDAGLGQMGANGQLLSPYFGSRWRPVAMSTDAPLEIDSPKDFGINTLCEKCQVCVRRCPGRALSKQKVYWRGVLKYKVIAERCIPMLDRYSACGVCIKVCPVQRYGLEAVLEHYSASGGQILGKGSDELEGFDLPDRGHFGPGEMPQFTRDESRIHYELLENLPPDAKPLFDQQS